MVGLGQIVTGGMDIGGLSAKKFTGVLGKSTDVSSGLRESENVVGKDPLLKNIFGRDSSFDAQSSESLLDTPKSSTLLNKGISQIRNGVSYFNSLSTADKVLVTKAGIDVVLGSGMIGNSIEDAKKKETSWKNAVTSSAVGIVGIWESITTATM